jgi:hypothetical protein
MFRYSSSSNGNSFWAVDASPGFPRSHTVQRTILALHFMRPVLSRQIRLFSPFPIIPILSCFYVALYATISGRLTCGPGSSTPLAAFCPCA